MTGEMRPNIFSDPVVDGEDDGAIIIRHDARSLPLEDATVDLIVTSPPYFALRSYRDGCEACGGTGIGNGNNTAARSRASDAAVSPQGMHVKRGDHDNPNSAASKRSATARKPSDSGESCPDCGGTGSGHFVGQIGSEDTPDGWLDALDACMVEWGRVLKPSGSVWINLGDKYATGQFGDTGGDSDALDYSYRGGKSGAQNMAEERRTPGEGSVQRKSLMGLPWRFAIRQIDNGWILRAEVIWDKPNGLPESVTDRVRRSHEQWFHFTREPRYFSGVDEIREPSSAASVAVASRNGQVDPSDGYLSDSARAKADDGSHGYDSVYLNPLGRLPGSVWSIPSEPLLIPDDTRALLDLPDHFAAFPQEFPRRIILGWSPTGICTECGEGRRPVVNVELEQTGVATGRGKSATKDRPEGLEGYGGWDDAGYPLGRQSAVIESYACACPTPDAPTRLSVIVDPFGGTGTVAGVARMLGRYGISNDLSASYNRLAAWRIWQSDHFVKTEQRTWADRQGSLL